MPAVNVWSNVEVLDHVVPQRQESDRPALTPHHEQVAVADHVLGEVAAIFGVAVQPRQPGHRCSSRRSEYGRHGIGISARGRVDFHDGHDRAPPTPDHLLRRPLSPITRLPPRPCRFARDLRKRRAPHTRRLPVVRGDSASTWAGTAAFPQSQHRLTAPIESRGGGPLVVLSIRNRSQISSEDEAALLRGCRRRGSAAYASVFGDDASTSAPLGCAASGAKRSAPPISRRSSHSLLGCRLARGIVCQHADGQGAR